MELDNEKLSRQIRKYRLAAKLSQEKLSELCDVTPSTISRIETNTNNCSLELLIRIANALNVGMDQLLFDSLPAVADAYLTKDIRAVLDSANAQEKRIILDIMQITLKTIRENTKKEGREN